jgi:SAM-dependent methyltransferase
MSSREHWDAVFRTKSPDRMSWFRPHLDRSLTFLEAANVSPSAGVIDVGGGTSTFVDDLLDRGYTNVTVLDLSREALDAARARLGGQAARVQWVCADITQVSLPENAFDFWHDRAVFHFLRDPLSHALRRSRPKVVETRRPHRRRDVRAAGSRKCSGLSDALHVRGAPLGVRSRIRPRRKRPGDAHDTLGNRAGIRLLLLPAARLRIVYY